MAEWERDIPASWFNTGEAEPFMNLVGREDDYGRSPAADDYMLQMYFHQAYWDDDTDQRTREYMQGEMKSYLMSEYGIDFDDLFDDWEDFRSWYDSI